VCPHLAGAADDGGNWGVPDPAGPAKRHAQSKSKHANFAAALPVCSSGESACFLSLPLCESGPSWRFQKEIDRIGLH